MDKKIDQTYESFVLRLKSNEELDFKYKEIVYSIVHNPPYVYLFRNVIYTNKEYKWEKVEKYLSIVQLLNQFTIEGKKIRELWNNISLLE